MSRISYVDGGVGNPLIEVLNGDKVIRLISLPEPASLGEVFNEVTITRTNITGNILTRRLGFRYSVKLDYAFLSRDDWSVLVDVMNDDRQGYALRFYPHDDTRYVYYDVIPENGMAAPYFKGRYLGYCASVEFTGKDVLPYIPRETVFAYFCSAGETGYSANEITYFTDCGETGYATGEISHYSAGSQLRRLSI